MQIPLALPRDAPSFRNFVFGKNQEIYPLLTSNPLPRIVFLWGNNGVGISHLLHAVHRFHQQGLDLPHARWLLSEGYEENAVHCLDDVHLLDTEAQSELFSVLKHMQIEGGSLVVGGHHSLLELAELGLRKDILTRFSSGVVYQVHPLSEEEKILALKTHAHDRGFDLPDEVLMYCLRHLSRDLRSLMGVLDALDKHYLQ